jgi:hypothetical protein
MSDDRAALEEGAAHPWDEGWNERWLNATDGRLRSGLSRLARVRALSISAATLPDPAASPPADGADLFSFLPGLAADIDAPLTMRTELSNVQDVDVAQGMRELQFREIRYQATLHALSQALPPSLVNFLR